MKIYGYYRFIILLAISLSVISCATKKEMYYWGNYSDSLYACKKKPGVETLVKHKEALENIVAESTKREMRIPPGVCAELGYIYAAQNNSKRAIELFNMEKKTYPESTLLMDRLISQTEKRTGTAASSGYDLDTKVSVEEIATGEGAQNEKN